MDLTVLVTSNCPLFYDVDVVIKSGTIVADRR